MTSPPEQASANLDDFDADYVREASTASCPSCRRIVRAETLVAGCGAIVTYVRAKRRWLRVPDTR